MDESTQIQILYEAVYISYLSQGMKPTIPPPVMGKQSGRLGSLTLV